MGLLNILFGTNDVRLRDAYNRAWWEADRGYVNPRKYSYLDRELRAYAQDNNITYEEAFLFAKTGRKTWKSVDTVTFLDEEKNFEPEEEESSYLDYFEDEDQLLLEYLDANPDEEDELNDLDKEHDRCLENLCKTITEIKILDIQIKENREEIDPFDLLKKNAKLFARKKELEYEKEIQEYNLFVDRERESLACEAYFNYRNQLIEKAKKDAHWLKWRDK
ncbi:MAG: hypothetical protein K5776_07275 [Lachnospiraceae bacterium]|nr:hypothetical protein [Lachnospiraceae bacterium]